VLAMWKTTKEFVKAVGKWWWAVTIDWLVGALLGTAQSFGAATILPHWVPYAIVLVGFLIACFIAFHRLRIERDQAVERLFETLPVFKVEVSTIMIGNLSSLDGSLSPGILVKMTIANRGAPSAALDFHLNFRSSEGKLVRGKLWWGEDDIKLSAGSPLETPVQTLRRDQHIATIAMNPIPKNGVIFGYLASVFHGMTRDEFIGAGHKIIIEFNAINDRHFLFEFEIPEGNESTKMLMHPAELTHPHEKL
jgi:hypothetical protein